MPVAPAQSVHEGELPPETRQRPEVDVVADAKTPVPDVPYSMALSPVKEDNVRPANSGDDEIAISWIVLTAPLLTEKLVELNDAIPFTVSDASSIVIVVPDVCELARVS